MKKQFYQALAALCSILLLLASSNVSAQTKVTGKVTDKASGNALPGVTVFVKGTNRGAATDPAGTFTVMAKPGETLVFSFVGYDPLETQVGSGPVNVSLSEKVGSLEEVVVTGYSSQKKKDLTGAVSIVKVDNLIKQPSSQIASQLQGQVSGVTILGSGQPGQEPVVKIRGVNTFQNNTPLYVVDGVPISNLADVNPNDVQNMQVLKDAGAASIYGARAANGVIIITTKRGTGKVKVSYDGYYGTQRPQSGNVWNILSPQEQANLKWMAIANTTPNPTYNDEQYGSGATPRLPDYIAPQGAMEGDPGTDPSTYYVNPNYKVASDVDGFHRIVKANKSGTDWFHEIFKPAPITSHNLSVAGGGDIGSYFFSFYYFNQQGTLTNTYNKRYAVRANSTYNVGEHIRIGENMEYSIINNPQISALTEGSGIGMAFREMPIIPVHDIMGNYAGSFGKGLGNARNPVAIQDRFGTTKTLASRLLGNVFAEADILQHFTLRTSFGGEIYSLNNHSFTLPEYENAENNKVNSYTEQASSGYDWTWTNTLTYHQNFNQVHDVKVLLGTEAFNNKGRTVGGGTQDYFSFDPDFISLSTGSGTLTNNSASFTDGLFSLFARVDYTFRDRYLIGALIRRDGSSRFGSNNRYGNFPAVSAAWRISQEEFMKNVSWISDLKLRGGYGIMGNQINVLPGNAFTAYGFDKGNSFYDIGGTGAISQGFNRKTIGNPDAKWESNVNANIGIDVTLFKGLLEVTADYYRKDVKDLLYNPELPGVFGVASAPYVNVAQMRNKGFDFSSTLNLNITKDLKLDLNANITTYNNKIVKISDAAPYFDMESRRFNGTFIIRNAIGQSISEFFGYKVDGFWNSQQEIDAANKATRDKFKDNSLVYQTDIKPGRFKFADVNGDGRITEADRTYLGNPNPKFSYGVNVGLKYKSWDFSMFLYGVQGNKIWNQVKWWTDFYPSFEGAKSKTALYDSWLPTRQNATAPIQETSPSFSTSNTPSSYFVENGSYLRAKNLLIGYTLPYALTERANISKFRVYVQAANLFTITKYSGIDPEITGGTSNFGVDEGAYPNQRQYLVGVNVTF